MLIVTDYTQNVLIVTDGLNPERIDCDREIVNCDGVIRERVDCNGINPERVDSDGLNTERVDCDGVKKRMC